MRIIDLTEMAASGNFGNRVWYHGTSKKKFERIKKSGIVKAFLADDTDPGEAIWLTSDLDTALSYGKVVLAIFNNNIKGFKVKRWSEYPHGHIKRFGLKKPESYEMVIQQDVPLKYWKLVDPNTGELVSIPK